jgi:RNA polymerase sigma factor (sigma-70 family)
MFAGLHANGARWPRPGLSGPQIFANRRRRPLRPRPRPRPAWSLRRGCCYGRPRGSRQPERSRAPRRLARRGCTRRLGAVPPPLHPGQPLLSLEGQRPRRRRPHSGHLVACIEGKDRYEGTGAFKSYLLGIAFRLLCRHYRSKQRLDARIDFASVSACDLAPSPSEVVAARQEQRLILAALRRIPLEHQALLELIFWEDFTAADAAVVLGIPVGTAKSRIRRAHQLLREQLAALAESPALLATTMTRLDDWARELRVQIGQLGDP